MLKIDYESPFPDLNVQRRHDPVATDVSWWNTTTIDNKATSAQIYVGKDTLLTDVCVMKSDNQFDSALSDSVLQRGSMSKIVSDSAQVDISNKFKYMIR